MNSAKLGELEKVAKAVEPKSWHYQEESDAYTHIVRGPNNRWIVSTGQSSKGDDEALARFIVAASPDTFLELIHKLRVAETALEIAVADANGASLPTLPIEHYMAQAERELGEK